MSLGSIKEVDRLEENNSKKINMAFKSVSKSKSEKNENNMPTPEKIYKPTEKKAVLVG